MWVTDIEGGYVCVNPSTGATRTFVGIRNTPTGKTRIVSTPDGLFVGGANGIDRIVPPPAYMTA